MKKTLIALMTLAGIAGASTTTYWNFEESANATGANKYTGTDTSVSYTETEKTTGSIFGDESMTTPLGFAATYTAGASYTIANGSSALATTLVTGANATTSFTLMSYVKFDGTSGEQFFFGTGTTNLGGLALGIHEGCFDFLVKSVNHYSTTAGGGWGYQVTAGEWHHYAVSYDASTNQATLFVDGTSQGAITMNRKNGDIDFNTNIGKKGDGMTADGTPDFIFGAASTHGPQDDFAGSIAQFQIISGAALDAAGVKAAANLVPEPATATLSLLALAGLCARRRRK